MTTATVPEHFSEWLAAMQPRMSGFIDFRLPSNIVKDFSREALAQFEEFLLSTWADAATFAREADEAFKDGAVRYVGEAFLREFGGGWDFTENPRALFTGVPVVRVSAAPEYPISPHHLMGSVLTKRTGRVLSKVWDGQVLNVEEMREERGADWRPRRDPVPGITEGAEAEKAQQPARDAWVAGLGDRITALRARVGEPDAAALDLSKESLPVLERLVLADFATREEVVAPERAEVRDQYVSYLGELFRRAAGGEWVVRPGGPDPHNPFIGNPYLRLGEEMAKVPVSALRLLVRDRKPGTLQRILDAYHR